MMINIYRWHSFHGKPTSCYIVLSPLARMTNTSRIPHISPCICRLAARWERIKTWLKIGRVWEVQQVAVADVAVGQKDKADMATLNRLWSCGAVEPDYSRPSKPKPDSTRHGSISTQCDPIRDPAGLNNGQLADCRAKNVGNCTQT